MHNCCETTRVREPAIRVKLPAVWVLVGVLPRFMAFGGWTVLAACVLIEEFGRPLQVCC